MSILTFEYVCVVCVNMLVFVCTLVSSWCSYVFTGPKLMGGIFLNHSSTIL